MTDEDRKSALAAICIDWVYGQVETEAAMKAVLQIVSPAWTKPRTDSFKEQNGSL